MANNCFTWNNATINWNNANFTWKELCLVEEVTSGGSKHVGKRLKNLKKEDKKVLISLFTRIIDENNNEINNRITKTKNTKTKVTIKDVEIILKEMTKAKITIFINE